ncbi:urea carboxylase [Acetobacter senegalensis]|uniref:urea carboxylase n=1 Tax=Acetobacter senegalensis TaxID=446692 RepID=UPI00209FC18D|nr:urea carboxylase [Acetobacter senegalensis]MCP1195624.1 urea carboxylase [Acetobacter senegalensis]
MFKKLLIANRGAIAARIERTLQNLHVGSVAVYSEADLGSLHVRNADQAISLGEGAAAETYLKTDKILAAARQAGAQAIHPGYGFLSENAAFAEECEKQGFAFVGPTPEQLRTFGLKHTARDLAAAQGVPMLRGTPLLNTAQDATDAAAQIGYPVMLKSTAGGGGIGMRVCYSEEELIEAFDKVRQLGLNNFSDGGVFIEKYIEHARHLEVQIFGDGQGEVIALGVRDCSIQRRNQKVIEETPAPGLPDGIAEALCEAAIRLGKATHYRSAGTVEFVYDSDVEQFYFLEVNTRLQVEHGVTEQVWGVDLVRWMVELAAGTLPPLSTLMAGLTPQGHAIQARLYAEDPGRNFQPSPGLVTHVHFPPADGKALRIDTWIEAGAEIPAFFDPMVAKVIAHDSTRQAALAQLDDALAKTEIYGVETNCAYLRQILAYQPFVESNPWTRCLEGLTYKANTFEVLVAGTQTTVQDFPGRLGYWAVGIPPSGPMDSRSFQMANRLLGNAAGTAGLEITMNGPTLRFNTDAVVAIAGAEIVIELDGQPCPMNTAFCVCAGSVLKLGSIVRKGARSYLALRGGVVVPSYLGSCSTFILGQFGGHAGRALRVGDVLHLPPSQSLTDGAVLPVSLALALPDVQTVRVIYGPHAAPEYFTPAYMETFFATEWEIHFNSSRTGIRLIGPKPEWVRESGGEAGLHPSNIHDNPYAIGAVDFTGDMPVILGPDGPSLGGFVCPVTVISADLWKLGQLRAGDLVRFVPVDLPTAHSLARSGEAEVQTLEEQSPSWEHAQLSSPIVMTEGEGSTRLVARLSGDANLLLEIGDPELDLTLRFRAHALMRAMEAENLNGIIDLTPGIRSLQIHYASNLITSGQLVSIIKQLWADVSKKTNLRVPSRIVHLPLSWDDPACQLAIRKYMTTVRKDAPWCPSNLEFIRRINDLGSIDDVYNIVFNASYVVMGLGDVYLGAPVATPLDPRHRLVTTKYNPARTWTAENSVGIGGAYLCVYGMEGPGGYQFVGRTLQMWMRYRLPEAFQGKSWLLRFFDQVRFYPVSAEELEVIRRDFPLGRYDIKIEQTEIALSDYHAFLEQHHEAISTFQKCQQAAFDAERQRWIENGTANFESNDVAPEEGEDVPLANGLQAVESGIAGNLWQVLVSLNDRVEVGQVVVVLESMKMEISLVAPCSGTVMEIRVQPGAPVRSGQCVIVIKED